MNKRKKKILTGVIIATLLVAVVGVTYALWSYFQIGKNQQLVAGEIYMKYTETSNTINIQDAMPSKTPGDDYFEFTIEGKNTYTKPIWYEIVINWGAEPEGRSERIPDEFLRFRLTEQLPGEEETEVIKEGKYEDFSKGKKIWVNTIGANSPETTITYKLYMWVSDEMVLGSGDAAASSDMDMETWNNDAFASVKVTVNGDFEEKEIDSDEEEVATPVSCFEYEEYDKKYIFNDNMTEKNISACTTYYQDSYFSEGESARAYCEGTGTRVGKTLKKDIINKLEEDKFGYMEENEHYQKLLEIGVLKTEPISPEIVITNYKEDLPECGTDVVIPSEINGAKVTIISAPNSTPNFYFQSSRNGSFFDKGLTSVVIPNSIIEIGEHSFAYNNLIEIDIPDSVTTIGDFAFDRNKLESIVIGKGIKYLEQLAFFDNGTLSDELYDYDCAFAYKVYGSLKNMEIKKSCDEMKNIERSSTDTRKSFPWNDVVNEEGLTIYGYENNEKVVCETKEEPNEVSYIPANYAC